MNTLYVLGELKYSFKVGDRVRVRKEWEHVFTHDARKALGTIVEVHPEGGLSIQFDSLSYLQHDRSGTGKFIEKCDPLMTGKSITPEGTLTTPDAPSSPDAVYVPKNAQDFYDYVDELASQERIEKTEKIPPCSCDLHTVLLRVGCQCNGK